MEESQEDHIFQVIRLISIFLFQFILAPAIHFLYKLICLYQHTNNRSISKKTQLILSATLGALSLVQLVCSIIGSFGNIHIDGIVFLTLYVIHCYILLLLTFSRLYYVSSNSIFRSSSTVTLWFKRIMISKAIIHLIVLVLYDVNGNIVLMCLMMAASECLLIVALFALNWLFLIWLKKVMTQPPYNSPSSATFVKYIILIAISTLLSICSSASTMSMWYHYVSSTDKTHDTLMFDQWFNSLSNYLNFICFMLAYLTSCKRYYQLLCGSIHRQSMKWIQYIGEINGTESTDPMNDTLRANYYTAGYSIATRSRTLDAGNSLCESRNTLTRNLFRFITI
eukprot:94230_1